ncbi:MAG: hypothetical protein M3P96_16570 [Actinomycetota bacterium]|nr:hypothetical protein [Actinomycetota bacterium]
MLALALLLLGYVPAADRCRVVVLALQTVAEPVERDARAAAVLVRLDTADDRVVADVDRADVLLQLQVSGDVGAVDVDVDALAQRDAVAESYD